MSGPGLEFFDGEEEAGVCEVIRERRVNRYHGGGPGAPRAVEESERLLTQITGSRYALGTNSCTSALVTVLRAYGIGPGDEVIVPCYCFVASAAAICHVGATPVFCNIDERLGLSAEAVEDRWTPTVKAVICVHMLGRPSNMEALQKVCAARGLILIEDVAQAFGASYLGRCLGAIGDANCLSFNVFKTLTCGDGGAILTNDETVYARCVTIHDHGFVPEIFSGAVRPELGFNFRMTELSGAVLAAQLRKLSRILETVRATRSKIMAALSLPRGVRILPSWDDAGQVGTSIVLEFDHLQRCESFCAHASTRPLSRTGAHYYRNIEEILGETRTRSTLSGVKSTQPAGLEASDSLLGRCIVIGVGVQDGYLGASLAVPARAQAAAIESLCAAVQRALDAAA